MQLGEKFKIAVICFIFELIFRSAIVAQDTPNVVIILADDLGYESLNSYGADKRLIRTPHIDDLAKNGMLFTDASTPASLCTPTRIGLLTGAYPWRTKLKYGVVNVFDPLVIDDEHLTIADMFKSKGYHTATIGKWHLGFGNKTPLDYRKKLTPGPLDLGFDYYFGVPQNHGDITGVYVENTRIYKLRSADQTRYSKSYYGGRYMGYDAPQRVNKEVMEDLTTNAVEWIRQQSSDKSFFLYFAPVAVHHPITPSDYMRGMSNAGPYGDFIQDIDKSVGRIIETLEYMGLLENTIIVFTSDNGAGIPIDKNSPNIVAINKGLRLNGDFRGSKGSIWEGGTRVPFIVQWPGIVRPGSISNQMINITDIFATIAEIIGYTEYRSNTLANDSFSFMPNLLGDNIAPRSSMVTASGNGQLSLRTGGWKYIDDRLPQALLKIRPNLSKNIKAGLYDLNEDPCETNNVYDLYPEKVQEMKRELRKIKNTEN